MLNNAKTTITSENDVQTRDVVLNHIVNEDYTFILADFSRNVGGREEWGDSKRTTPLMSVHLKL